VKFHCPFCDYSSGNRGSVEGHISGKSDSSHKGRVGRSHRSEIIEEAEADSLGDRLGSIMGDSPAIEKSAKEEIHQLRADLARLDEKLSQRIDNLEATVNAQPSADELREQAVKDVTNEVKSELETIEETKQEALEKFEKTTDNLNERLIRESKRAAKTEVSEQNEAVTESLRKMAIMLSTLPTKTKAQCPKCGSYVRFKEAHKVGARGTNLTCPDCTTQLIEELPPSVDSNDSEYV
jgi:predicted Zn-ribbon and HTH transcriptional regulator